MFPNATMMQPGDLERHPRHDGRRPRPPRLAGVTATAPTTDATHHGRPGSSWPTKKPLNIGIIGYGFMGRTHSNAYKQAPQFFDLAYRPVLKAVCGRDEDKAKAFAENWGYESVETDWRKLLERDGHRRRRHLHAEQHARRDRHRRGRGRQDDPLREAAGDGPEAGPADGRRRREGRRAEHRLVQLPPRPGRHPGQAADRRGPARPDLPLPGQLPPGLDDLRRPPPGRRRPLAARRRRGRLRRHRRPAGPLHRHRPLAQRRRSATSPP